MHLSGKIAAELKNWKTVVRVCFAFVFCMIMILPMLSPSVVSAAQLETPKANQHPNGEYLLDKVITWNDGNTEQVQILKDGFFRLDGEKKKLIGMGLGTSQPPAGRYGEFFLARNMATYEKELAYLQSINVRLIHVELNYIIQYTHTVDGEQKAYKDLLDLIYRYKMLVIPEIELHGAYANGDFSNCVLYTIDGVKDTPQLWAARCMDTISRYDNVVGMVVENELDIKMKKADSGYQGFKDQVYTAQDVTNHLTSLIEIVRSKFEGPVIHKLAGTWLIEPEIKKAALDVTDLGAFDCYASSSDRMDSFLEELQAWLNNAGHPSTGWWCMEFNAGWAPVVWDGLDSSLIQSIFDHGATIAIFYVSNWSTEPASQLFGNDGNPNEQLVRLARDFDKLQAPLTDQIDVAANNKSNMSSNDRSLAINN